MAHPDPGLAVQNMLGGGSAEKPLHQVPGSSSQPVNVIVIVIFEKGCWGRATLHALTKQKRAISPHSFLRPMDFPPLQGEVSQHPLHLRAGKKVVGEGFTERTDPEVSKPRVPDKADRAGREGEQSFNRDKKTNFG